MPLSTFVVGASEGVGICLCSSFSCWLGLDEAGGGDPPA